VGEPARIVDGPFAGLEGIVVKSDFKKELFVITLELLQLSVAMKLEGYQISKL
jgi:transcription antitermination factor NusG